jgi:arylsulfatase A-like enzyme/tetratricopeptide (TPR) repeat protein
MAKKKRAHKKKRGGIPQARASSPPAAAGPPPKPKKDKIRRDRAVDKKGFKKFRLYLVLLLVVIGAGALVFILKPRRVQITREGRLNVLLITLDTTRADRLGVYGYAKARTPNLDALARNGVLFSNAYSQVPLTLPSHCSIMTGTTPLAHGVHNNGTYVLPPDKITLAKVLKGQGYKTAAFVASFSVDSRFGLDQGFDIYDDNFQEGAPFKALNAERKAEQVLAVFSPWLDKLKDEPFFAWVHFFDPHLPYNPPSPYREEFKDRLYDGEVAYMDFIIGEVMRKIKERNLLGRTLVVVAGDHGEAFGEKGEAGHGVFLYEMTLRVPLIFYAENHLPSNSIVPARVRLIDIMPTVLDMLNIPRPASSQGISLIPYIQKKKKNDLDSYIETFYPKENFGWSPLVGLIAADWKYVRAPKEELYNLKADPGEGKNAFPAEAKIVAKLKASLDALIRESVVPGATAKRTLSAEDKDRLRSLGYVDFSEASSKGDAADPKDKLDELRMVQEAEKDEFEGNFAAAAALHEKMLVLRPNAASSYINLALAQARMNNFEATIKTLKQGIEKIPGSEILLSRLGYTYLVTGRTEEALATMADVLKINPRHLDALTASAVILGNSGKIEEALSFFERALSVEPENKFVRKGYAESLTKSGRIADAIAVYTKLTQDFPQDDETFQLLGITYALTHDFDKAVEYLKDAAYIKPTPKSYYYLAIAYREKGEAAEAVRYLELYLDDTRGEPENRVKNARTGLNYLKTHLK